MTKAGIVLVGPSGVGKGTQAFRLTHNFPDLVHIDTGQEIKRRVDDPLFSQDPKVEAQRVVYYRGDLNDTYWVTDLICERINACAREGHGVVLSGSPRTIYEAKQIGPLLTEVFPKRVLVIRINVSEVVIRQRMASRVVCDNTLCGFPETKDSIALLCTQCGKGKFVPKSLDSEEGMRRRISWFYEQTVPAISHLSSLGIPVVEVDGEGDEEEVFFKILTAIEKILS